MEQRRRALFVLVSLAASATKPAKAAPQAPPATAPAEVVRFPAAAGDTRLAGAAKRSDLDAVKPLLAEHVDVNAAEADGSTALLWATHNSSIAIVRALIASGADLNAANRYGLTPLIEACRLS